MLNVLVAALVAVQVGAAQQEQAGLAAAVVPVLSSHRVGCQHHWLDPLKQSRSPLAAMAAQQEPQMIPVAQLAPPGDRHLLVVF
jgi:hypothetical protein